MVYLLFSILLEEKTKDKKEEMEERKGIKRKD
jgi:hypothetical protein